MKYIKTDRLFCFSPPIMLATFVIEVALALYVLWRYRSEKITWLVVAILLFLALFQIAEYNVCEGAFGLDSLAWSRIGYASITILPALGLHAVITIAKVKQKSLVLAGYVAAIGFAGFFLTVGNGLTGSVCTGNYVIFEIAQNILTLYAAYYYGFEIIAASLAYHYAKLSKSRTTRRALYGLMTGYLTLLIPTTTVNIIDPETIRAIPSIMCGFAVFLALIIVFWVLPYTQVKKK